jgi:hypothetical protein
MIVCQGNGSGYVNGGPSPFFKIFYSLCGIWHCDGGGSEGRTFIIIPVSPLQISMTDFSCWQYPSLCVCVCVYAHAILFFFYAQIICSHATSV